MSPRVLRRHVKAQLKGRATERKHGHQSALYPLLCAGL